MPANCLSTYQRLRGRQALKGATVHLHGAQAAAAARGWLISAAMEHGTGETRSLRQTSRNSKRSRSRGKSASAGNRETTVNLDVRMGGMETSKKAGQDTQSCRAVGSCNSLEGHQCWKHWERGREAEARGEGNAGSPEMNGNGCEDLRLMDLTDKQHLPPAARQPLEKGQLKRCKNH